MLQGVSKAALLTILVVSIQSVPIVAKASPATKNFPPNSSIDHLVVKTGKSPSALPQTKAEQRQLWNLQNADIQAVVETIAQLTGRNFVVDPRVQGRVTLISVKPMSVDEMYNVFLSMLQVLNYAAIPAGKVTKIVPAMDARGYGATLATSKNPGVGDEIVVRVVPVNNVSAAQLVSILQPLTLSSGSVSAYQPSNALVLAGTATSINQLVTIIHHLDDNSSSSIRVVNLKYADATKLAAVIQQLQSVNSNQGKVNNAAVVADQAQNTLLVSGNAENCRRTVSLIKELDTPNAAGANNTAVLRLNYLTAKKVSEILTKLAQGYVEQEKSQHFGLAHGYGVGTAASIAAMVSIQAVEDDNAIVISGPYQIVQSLKHVVKQIDVRPQQVLVQAIIVKIDESTMTNLGVQWGAAGDDAGSVVSTVLGPTFSNGMGVIKSGNLRVLISALHKSGDTDILATPSILVLNNQKATISDGKNIGILARQNMTNVSNENNGTVPFNNFERKDVTLSLDVTPQIAPDNTVRLTLSQQDDSLAQDAQNSDSGNPTINTSKIKTTVMVDSGDILVLGGLISNNNIASDQKIPILGDIPILGKIFHYIDKSTDKKNLMIFIRPVILSNKAELERKSMEQYDYIRYQQMRRRAGLGLSHQGQLPALPEVERNHAIELPPPFSVED